MREKKILYMSNLEIIGMGAANPSLQRTFINKHSIGYRYLGLDTPTDVLDEVLRNRTP